MLVYAASTACIGGHCSLTLDCQDFRNSMANCPLGMRY